MIGPTGEGGVTSIYDFGNALHARRGAKRLVIHYTSELLLVYYSYVSSRGAMQAHNIMIPPSTRGGSEPNERSGSVKP